MSENRKRIQTLIGIWTAAGKIRSKEELLEDPEREEFASWLDQQSKETNESFRDEPITADEQEDENQIALHIALCEAANDAEPPAITPEAWESRGHVIIELVELGELKIALELISEVDEFHAGDLLFTATRELIKSDMMKAIALMRTSGYIDKVGWARISELWTVAYLANPQPMYLDKAMKSCASCATLRQPHGALHPLMRLWKATGHAPARKAAEKIASSSKQPGLQARAYNIIGRATGEPDKFLSGFAAAEMIPEQGTRVSAALRLSTTIVNLCFHLNPKLAGPLQPPGEPRLSAEQLKFILDNMPHDRWRQALIAKLKACGIPAP